MVRAFNTEDAQGIVTQVFDSWLASAGGSKEPNTVAYSMIPSFALNVLICKNTVLKLCL